MNNDEIIKQAHRKAWRYKQSSDPHHSDTYTFNLTTLLDFVQAVIADDRAKHQDGQEPVAWQDCAGKLHLRYRDAVLDFEREPVPLFSAPQPATPKGYKLVPLEPTEEMLVAGGDDLDYCLTCGYDNGPGNCGPVYTAMVEAAPTL